MDFEEMRGAYRRIEDEMNESIWRSKTRGSNYGYFAPTKPVVYDHIVVCTSTGEWLICRTNSASSMFSYEEIACCAVKHEAEDIARVLNGREAQK